MCSKYFMDNIYTGMNLYEYNDCPEIKDQCQARIEMAYFSVWDMGKCISDMIIVILHGRFMEKSTITKILDPACRLVQ